ncbi:TRAP transporter substrate-binding protein [Rhodovulum sulfidophilum]|uniref:TRAP transporter substrate-binding protein n=1 Tax=Rhodovulum sulfidophilum TaxID=35806 RepID=UPI0019242D69|nr:TRAP transporter substrate-binding protein [Rhodovulum sulfidophilum]MBL3559669.1 TRAP transporter substrate-binding protein [Rhodovulum sulfidophilum]MBL3576105.1 TRAP transporter substrate-binding protein [Rhodovulum sulfidophilum]MCE8433333.1 TRAP transporter substrate-binding protein [Rhodovulum sulfidophilum]MCF4117282.1 TRAP transporter substrate-binding protein [Rhodovulum sulfidophilum]
MKPLLPRAFGLCLGLSLLAGAASAQTVLRVAGNFPEEHSATGAMNVFKEEVERLSGGDLVVQNFPAMQLGGAQENVDQVRSGAIFAVFTSIAYFTRSVPELEAVSLPFLFDSREKAFEVMDGPVGKLMDKALLEQGFVNLGYGELGFRHVTNSVRPLTRLEDFQGLKIRLQPNEVHLETFRALGANPQSLDISELYSALQQKVLDGEENPYNIIYTRRFFEVQKYLSDTGHFFDFINVVANKDAFDALSPENQEAVRSAMRSAIEWQRAEAARVDLEFREKLVAEGMQFDEIPAAERARLREATASIAESLKERVDPEVIDLVLEQAAQ